MYYNYIDNHNYTQCITKCTSLNNFESFNLLMFNNKIIFSVHNMHGHNSKNYYTIITELFFIMVRTYIDNCPWLSSASKYFSDSDDCEVTQAHPHTKHCRDESFSQAI